MFLICDFKREKEDVLAALRKSARLPTDLCRLVFKFRGSNPRPFVDRVLLPAPLDDREEDFGGFGQDLFSLPGV